MKCQARRNSTETSNLKQTIENLELELSATRREADEYHKATIEKNSEISSLENKVNYYYHYYRRVKLKTELIMVGN